MVNKDREAKEARNRPFWPYSYLRDWNFDVSMPIVRLDNRK